MKATGIVREIDQLGRVVIPIELRRTMDLPIGTPIEVYVDNESIILKKYEPGCVFCGLIGDLTSYKGKNICPKCMKDLKSDVRGSK